MSKHLSLYRLPNLRENHKFKSGTLSQTFLTALPSLFRGQYYGYIWSEVYSSDLFASRWLKEGLLNPQTGLDYRREVISRGGSVDATEMLRNFLGREPNDVAFLKSKGLSVE
jgi:Zn-dependent oligopeptidase